MAAAMNDETKRGMKVNRGFARLARYGLMYQDLIAAVVETYTRWGVVCTTEEAKEVVRMSCHRDILIRREVEASDVKKASIYREIATECSISESTVRKAVTKVAGPVGEVSGRGNGGPEFL